jgi:AcrR family transcriptional regulator
MQAMRDTEPGPGNSSVPDRKSRTRNCILRAAEKQFIRRGYRGTTMDDIAREAEVSKATIYAYFKGKEELLAEMQGEAFGSLARRAGQAVQGEEEPLLLLEQAFDSCYDLIQRRESLLGIYGHDPGLNCRAPMPVVHKLESEALERLSSVVRSGREKGVFREFQPELTALLLFKAFEAAVLFLQAEDCPLDREEVEDGMFEFIRRGIMT